MITKKVAIFRYHLHGLLQGKLDKIPSISFENEFLTKAEAEIFIDEHQELFSNSNVDYLILNTFSKEKIVFVNITEDETSEEPL